MRIGGAGWKLVKLEAVELQVDVLLVVQELRDDQQRLNLKELWLDNWMGWIVLSVGP